MFKMTPPVACPRCSYRMDECSTTPRPDVTVTICLKCRAPAIYTTDDSGVLALRLLTPTEVAEMPEHVQRFLGVATDVLQKNPFPGSDLN